MRDKYAVALGMFDGVHIGHKAVLDGAVNSRYKSVAVTFSALPFKNGGSIMSGEDKAEKLKSVGIDEVLFLDFFKVKDMSPEEFLLALAEKYELGKICCGFNYRFGKKAAGDTAFLKSWCEEREIEFFECPEVLSGGVTVSSTYIKELLLDGEVKDAEALLEEPFSFACEVISGEQRGRTWGLPTANQIYPEGIARVKNGVYQTVVELDGKLYDGVTNIGIRPTYITDYISAETYILNYSGDCYGKKMKTSLIDYLREERRFSSPEELAAAIKRDAEYVKKHSRV